MCNLTRVALWRPSNSRLTHTDEAVENQHPYGPGDGICDERPSTSSTSLFHHCQNLDLVENQQQYQTEFSNATATEYHAFPPVPLTATQLSLYRRPDTLDTFASYKYRSHPRCNVSSLSLHTPFSPLCPSRQSFLDAFSHGGRIGFDSPFMPRSCDMRWFTTQETCSILSRFEKVIVVGDSMMRHIVGALNVLLREDLGYGAVTGWNFSEEERRKCFCMHQMDVKACSVQGVYKTEDVLRFEPESFACKHWVQSGTSADGNGSEDQVVSNVNLIIELMLKFPLDPTELGRLQALLPKARPKRPIAFVFGHGLWNDLDVQATVNWLQGILESIYQAAPYLKPENLPREAAYEVGQDTLPSGGQLKHLPPMAQILFITPSAAGPLKPDQWIQSQGDKALQVFEASLHTLIHGPTQIFWGKGIEHLGTWNMSIQMQKWDGVHLDLRGNLIKAMGVINWLAGIEIGRW